MGGAGQALGHEGPPGGAQEGCTQAGNQELQPDPRDPTGPGAAARPQRPHRPRERFGEGPGSRTPAHPTSAAQTPTNRPGRVPSPANLGPDHHPLSVRPSIALEAGKANRPRPAWVSGAGKWHLGSPPQGRAQSSHSGVSSSPDCSPQASLSITRSRSLPTRVHRVGDAIQPSHPLSPPSPPAPNPSQHQSLFQ